MTAWLRILGWGLAPGLAAGLAAGMFEVVRSRHLEHGTYWLAAEHLTRDSVPWAAATAAAIVLLAVAWNGARRRIIALPAALAILAMALFAGSLFYLLASPRMAAKRAEGKPSVVVVCIDTMRADRLGILGDRGDLTPRLDRLAREGVLFEQANANAPWTLPSHVSIFTSLLPFDHGVRHAGASIPRRFSMLAEHFLDAGYRTAAFTGGGYVSYGYRFDQGIETYRDHDERAEGGPGRIAEEALAWVRETGGAPFFLFVHTYEPHFPYAHDDFADPADAGRLTVDYDPDEPGLETLTEAERRFAVGLYDSDVAHADRVIGGMLETMAGEGVLDDAILVVLSDHGEDCWDHDATNLPRHGHTLYQELLHVPLFIRAPGRIREGARVATPVSLLDVAPTILDLAGLPEVGQHRGRSLANACRSAGEPQPLPILAESTRYGPERFSRREGDLKAIATPFPGEIRDREVEVRAAPEMETFDLVADPGELTSLATEDAAAGLVRQVSERAADALERAVEIRTDEFEPSGELLEQLRSLGYVDQEGEKEEER